MHRPESANTPAGPNGSHPLVTVLFYGGIIAMIVVGGSMVSKNRKSSHVAEIDSAPRVQLFPGN